MTREEMKNLKAEKHNLLIKIEELTKSFEEDSELDYLSRDYKYEQLNKMWEYYKTLDARINHQRYIEDEEIQETENKIIHAYCAKEGGND